jgi:hypothetical protein
MPVSNEPTERRNLMSEYPNNSKGAEAPPQHPALAAPPRSSALAPFASPAPQGSLRCDGVVGLRSSAAISLALSWAEAAKERDALATECRNKGDINEALWLENAAAAYTRCARELLQLTGCPDNRQPEPNEKAETRSL